MSSKRHWYHCSSYSHGQTWVARRRHPSHMSADEPKTPRLCVCPTIPGCFAARLFNIHRPVYVFRTETKCRGITPRDVWDQVITGEKWLVPPVSMMLVQVIDWETNDRIQEAIRAYHVLQKATSSFDLRAAQYARAVEILGGDEQELWLVSKMREVWEIGGIPLVEIDMKFHERKGYEKPCDQGALPSISK